QPAFDSGQRRHRLEQPLVADLLLDCPRADQADLSLLQGTSYVQHNGVGVLLIGLRCMHGPARAVVQAFPAQGGKALPPFAQPPAFARDVSEYLARTPAFEAQPDRLAAPIQFVIVSCHSASFGDSMAAITPCSRCREPCIN